MSEWNTPFLDLFVYIDPQDGQVHHKPYSKPLNHKERIPWASHHPQDVKKGTFIGEMSRLATLSSKPEHYLDALEELKNLYLARGYPTNLVLKWLKDYRSKRWEDRLKTERIAPEKPFVLKSYFNPAWMNFNVQELGNIVTETWQAELAKFKQNMIRQQKAAMKPEGDPSSGPFVHNIEASSG